MKKRVYIETSVVSYLTARISRDLIAAGHQQMAQEWWDKRRGDFGLVASQFVWDEAAEGDPEAAGKRLALLKPVPFLEVRDDVINLASALVAEVPLPPKAARDALHIAVAAVNGVEFLLTWNCAHIANAEIKGRIQAICWEHGCECPNICTPEELLGE